MRIPVVRIAGLAFFLGVGTCVNALATDPPVAAAYSGVTISQLQANWTDPTNPPGTTYNAILSTGPSPSTNGLAGNVPQTTPNTFAVFSGLAVNTLYFVDVQAADSSFASLGSASTLANAPTSSAPIAIQTNAFTATWAPNGNPLGTTYIAQLSTDPGFGSLLASSSTLNTSATFAGLTPNTTYYSQVEAINIGGVATGFTGLPAVVTFANAPGPNAFTSIDVSQVQANWTADGNPDGTLYTIILSTAASPSTNGLAGNITVTTANTFALFTGLVVNTAYYADVKAAGSVFTTLGSAPTLADAPAQGSPTNIGISQITANWGTNGNPAGTSYLVQASTDMAFGSIAAFISTTASSATLTGLAPNTAYYMRVQALNQASTPTTFTSLPSATTLENTANVPGAAGFSNVTASALEANWTANGNPPDVSYTAVLSIAPSPGTNGLAANQTVAVSTTSATFINLSANTLYYVDVNATSTGGNSPFLSLGSVATLANAPAPANPTNVGVNSITANWGTNNNPAGTTYKVEVSTDGGFSSVTTFVTTLLSSAALTGLSAHTVYFMQVEALNQNSIASAFISLPSATTLESIPNAPGTAAFTNVTANQLEANWTAGGNAADTTYTVILSSAPSPSTNNLAGNQSLTTSNLSATFSGLIPNVLYYAEVNATSTGGNSVYSSLGSVATLANAPTSAAPTAIGIGQITANWGTSGNPPGTSYLVQASTDAAFGSIATALTVTTSSATLTGLVGDTLYFMKVQATNQNGAGTAFTALPSAATLENIPSAPGVASFNGLTSTGLRARWTTNNNPSDVTYTAILSSAASPSTNGLAGNQTVTTNLSSATFSGLSPNALYFVDVNATSTGGSSAYSSLGSIATLANMPISAAPTNIQPNQMTANWGNGGNPATTVYLVQASLDSGFASITMQVSTSSLSGVLTGLSPQTLYFMRVQAKNQSGLTTSFTALPSATTISNPPNAPGSAGFTAVAANQLTTNWIANGNPAGTNYTVILSSAPSPSTNGLPANQSATTSSTSATFSGLLPNTYYFVQVKASNGSGDSAYTDLGSVPTLADPPAAGSPTNIQTNQITATWETNSNPAGTVYLVQASADSGFGSIASGITTTNSSATLMGLLATTTYYMRVDASNQSGLPTSFTLLPSAVTLNNPPGPPGSAGFSAIGTNQLSANWTVNGNPAGTNYTAILSTAPSPSTNGLSGNSSIATTSTSATFGSLVPNTLYYVDVNAANGGAGSAFTSLGSVPTLANAPTPSNPTDIQTNQITANWGVNENPAGTQYLVQASADAGFGTITSAKTTTASSATLNGLLTTTLYYMRVQASNQSGLPTTFTALPSAATLTVPPTVPAGAGFNNVTTTQLQANWTANGNAAGTNYTAVLSSAPSPSTNGLSGNQSITTTLLTGIFSGLSPNTLYYVEVKASNTGGDSAFADLGFVPTLANPPTSNDPTEIQTNQITANWGVNGNPPGTQYLVQASADAGFASIASAKTTTASSATLNGLLDTTLYFMRVQASNQSGLLTSFTFLPSTTTLGNPPTIPSGAGFTNITTTQIEAQWITNGNAAGTSYTAILSSAPSPSTNNLGGNQSVTTSSTSVTFSDLSPNILYYVEVNASNGGGASAFADLGSAATLANPPNSANPTGITSNGLTANWIANGNPDGTLYRIQASLDPGFAFITVGKSTTSLSTDFSGLTPETTYYLRVQAVNQSGNGTSFTPLPTVVTSGNAPVAPGAASFSNVAVNQLQANWTQNGNPTGTLYTVILSTASSPGTNTLAGNQNLSGTGTFAIFAGLFPNTLYYADVQASNANGQSVFTSLGQIATLANPPAFANPTSVGANQITANWNANGNPDGTSYIVQASPDPLFGSLAATNTSTMTFSLLVGLSPNTTYYMRVQSLNQNFVGSAFVNLPSTTTLANAPAIPGPLSFTAITTNQFQANWTANGNPPDTVYTLILSTEPSPTSNGLTGNQTVTTTGLFNLFAGLVPNTNYYVDVRASNAAGQSAVTSLGSATTPANPPTSATPTGIGNSQITANWGANGNPPNTLYLVQIGLAADFSSLINASVTDLTSFVFTGLSGDTTYYMQVEAIDLGGAVTAFTVLPPAKTVVTAPGVPVITASQFTDTSITWTWGSIPNATGYRVVSETGINVSGDLPSGTLEWQETGLAVNTGYTRGLVTFNPTGSSSSTLVTAFTLAHEPINVSTQVIVGTGISLQVNWQSNGNPSQTQYIAQISQANSAPRQLTVMGTQAIFDNLQGATTYFVNVQAINGAGAASSILTAITPPQEFASGQICPTAASELAFTGPLGQVRVDIPVGAFSNCIQLTVQIPGSFPTAPSSGTPLQGTQNGIELDNGQSPMQPSVPITLTVPFSPATISDSQRNRLVLARYDPVHTMWIMLNSTVDNDQNTVTAQTDHLSLYQVMVSLPTGDLSNIRVYPNPFRPAIGDQQINFANVPTDASIQIFSLTGEKVRDLTVTSLGTAVWDGLNHAGRAAASGVYFAVIKSGSDKTIEKVAIQR